MNEYLIRDVSDPADLAELEGVQQAAWGYTDLQTLPATMLRISAATGGVVLGAYPKGGGEAVGLAYGFPALERGEVWHHSHLLALRPQARGSGLAVALKLAQRERVLAQGIGRMTWTFDPLVTRNARLNFGKLGVRAATYLPDWYGPQHDRLLVTWDLTLPHAERPAPLPSGVKVLEEVDGRPRLLDFAGTPERLLVAVPLNATPDEAEAWRLALRGALLPLLGRSYVVTDLAREGERAYYVLVDDQQHERVYFSPSTKGRGSAEGRGEGSLKAE